VNEVRKFGVWANVNEVLVLELRHSLAHSHLAEEIQNVLWKIQVREE
jgi:hypothetical protein